MSLYRDIAKNLLLSSEFLESMTDQLALEIEKQLRAHAGGDTLYIAKHMGRDAMRTRDEEIRKEFTGDNYYELTVKHNLTLRQIRRIVQKK